MSIAKFDNEDFHTKAPDLLADLAKHTVVAAKEFGICEELAENIGMIVAMKIGQSWGGLNVYMPKALELFACEREKQIYNEFTGNNHSFLAKKYGLSLQWIYKIVKRVQKEEVAKRQLDMFKE
ncbi:Mor transcription activator family protein [Glaesserella parasuis]|uniref:Bacteriophage transcriptional regulator n=4 Tax=Glaesserella parasuis TaxID=738 RepID=B8F587_GLAP5|nr:Mor transcription activator family protein [Glaesserella parasuis]ACL32489.1 bacteriophage transcriptional regulator [Glaesserella parasuis SH0165]EMY45396.1 bacteriophage transcriptional regulator [Glaesserella parasuis gx033]MDG6240663.1 Mor transcription activator family protein [Glaesserella parasuis]MDG6248380.1 Mor transcription activator family protein [Glaesserella parasuis]MDG6264435.1 Mor transcription activator family protein [Glaesserella parasuis]